ncbi:MAG: M48 family metalloprotease [Sinobacteraceae bacterium]|nr:M48 family metalloprotease [Nevskiaceae bacterium]
MAVKRFALWAAAFGAVVICGAQAFDLDLNRALGELKNLKTAVIGPDLQEEEEIGRVAAATLLGAAHPVSAPALEAYVNKVGLWVALQSERPDLPWRFAVLDTDSINAFAAPGGYVLITRGLLMHLHSEAELAGALGHEIAHVVLKHHLHALRREAGTQLMADLSSQAVARSSARAHLDPQLIGALSGQFKTLYSRGLDKSDEYAADQLGAQLAARAGYDPYGLAAVLQTLDGIDPSAGALALLYRTHPRPADRLAALMKISDRLDAYGAQATVSERFDAQLAAFKKP